MNTTNMSMTIRLNKISSIIQLLPIFAAIILFFSNASYADTIDKARLFSRVSGITPKEVFYLADSAEKAGDESKAVSLYLYFCNNLAQDNSQEISEMRSKAYMSMGNILAGQGNNSGALEMYVKGLSISDTISGKPYIAEFYKNIGNIYSRIYDYERGCHYYEIGLSYCKIYPDKEIERKLYMNLAGNNVFLGNIDKAEKYRRSAKELIDPNDSTAIFMDKYNSALIFSAQNKHKESLAKYKETTALAINCNLEPRYLCSSWQGIYREMKMLGMSDSALIYIHKCLDYVNEKKIGHLFPGVLDDISNFYKDNGRMDMAHTYRVKFLDMRDSIQNIREFNAAKHVQFLHEADKISNEIKTLENRRIEHEGIIKQYRIIIICAVGALLIISAFMLIILSQKKKINSSYISLYRLNKSLEQNREELRKNNKDLSDILKEREYLIEKLTSEKSQSSGDHTPVLSEESKEDAHPKYYLSNLDDINKRKLSDAITDIMESGLEFCNPDFSLERLASLVYSNRQYVSQIINDVHGKSFSNYVNEYRVALSTKRLTDESYISYTIKAIGESVGFKTHATFITVFRKFTGMTPSMYQKMAKSHNLDS